MTEQEAFQRIDAALEEVKQKVNFRKRVTITTTPRSDWLIFSYRKFSWKFNGVHFMIEVFPEFLNELIIGWTICAIAWYDLNGRRHFIRKTAIENVRIDFIAENALPLLAECFEYLSGLQKSDIPVALRPPDYLSL